MAISMSDGRHVVSVALKPGLLRHDSDNAATNLLARLSARLRDEIVFALVDDQYMPVDIVGTGQRHVLCNARVVRHAVLSCNHVAQIAEMMLVVRTVRRAMRRIDRREVPAAAFA